MGISTSSSSLATYVNDTFTKWLDNRKPLETKWNDNLNAFKNISTGKWKLDENYAKEKDSWHSSTFIGMSRQKCITMYSIIVNILLRDGKIPFKMKSDDELPEGTDQDNAEETYALEMQRLIEKQMKMGNLDRVYMQNILAACVLGETWQKLGITFKAKKKYVPIAAPDGTPSGMFDLVEDSNPIPSAEYLSPYNVVWDMEDDDQQNNAGTIHFDAVSPFWLRKQKGKPGFDDAMIEKVIREYAATSESNVSDLSPKQKEVAKRKKTIPYREMWGRIPATLAKEYEKNRESNIDSFVSYENDGDEIEGTVCVAGNEVVRFVRTEQGKRPFRRMMWSEDLEGTGGVGLLENTNDLQLVLNGIGRAIEDNNKLSGNVIIATKDRFIDGDLDAITPGMRIHLNDDCKSASEAIQSVMIPDTTVGLTNFFQIVERMFDDNSMVPKISQGIQTNNDATAFEISKQVESSGKYAAAVLRNFDEGLIAPDVEYYYEFNMNDPDCTVKGNFNITPCGYVEYQNSIEKMQKYTQLFGFVNGLAMLAQIPQLGKMRFTNMVEEGARALGLDVREFLPSADETKASEIKEQEAAAAQAQMLAQREQETYELSKQKMLAEIEKLNAEKELALAKIQIDSANAKNSAVKTIAEIESKKKEKDIPVPASVSQNV